MPPALSSSSAWQLLLGLRRLAAEGGLGEAPFGLRLSGMPPGPQEVLLRPASSADWDLLVSGPDAWETRGVPDPSAAELLDLYLSVCLASPERPLTVAHLGQSLDGRIATATGHSHYVTGPENIVHMHRMRALCDVVVVGASTVELDDPQLTTRLVAGPSPLRAVLDPNCRLDLDRKLFRDPESPTLLICGDRRLSPWRTPAAHLEILELPLDAEGLAPDRIIAALRARGCSLVFIEGGGRTVTRFLEAAALDRLQLAIAPLIIGDGRQGLDLAGRTSLADALRPRSRRFAMGEDVLFDCDLRAEVG